MRPIAAVHRALVTVAAWLAMTGTAAACPVCLGSAESPLLDAARLGVLALAAVTVVVLAAFARWFLRLRALQAGEDERC